MIVEVCLKILLSKEKRNCVLQFGTLTLQRILPPLQLARLNTIGEVFVNAFGWRYRVVVLVVTACRAQTAFSFAIVLPLASTLSGFSHF